MRFSPYRLLGAMVALMAGLVILWQAGLIFGSDNGETSSGGTSLELEPADTSIDTATPPGTSAGLDPGDVAPDFEFSSYQGERLRLSDFRGRPVLVNFWATWCGPCRSEMPAIDEALQRYREDDLAVIAMNRGEPYGRAADWLDDLGLSFTAFGHDPEESVYMRYIEGSVAGLPISYFIDPQGVITEKVLGPLRESDLDFAIERTIEGYEAN